ncbi:MAG: hypothetical protein U1E73_11650 [Planctomycetota bacterium]
MAGHPSWKVAFEYWLAWSMPPNNTAVLPVAAMAELVKPAGPVVASGDQPAGAWLKVAPEMVSNQTGICTAEPIGRTEVSRPSLVTLTGGALSKDQDWAGAAAASRTGTKTRR